MRVSQRAGELRAAGHPVVSFGAGEPDFPSPTVAVEAARQALADGFTNYTPAAGIADLRAAVADDYRQRHGAPWQASQTVITVGGKAALFEIVHCLVDPGDEVIVPSPSWVTFAPQIQFAGGTTVPVPLSWRDRFRVHADAVIGAMTDRTRMVLINAPSNPSGGIISAEDLRQIVEACAERGIALLSDETYEHFVYDGAVCASAATLASEFPDTITLVGSFSKTYSMTGWRVGYGLGPANLIKKAIAVQSHATSNPTSFAMKGALAALHGAHADVETMIATFARRRTRIVDHLSAIPGINCTPPDGAFYVFPDVSSFYDGDRITGSIDFAEYLLESAGVALVPGVAFGDDNHVRLSFACSDENIDTGMAKMAEALAKL